MKASKLVFRIRLMIGTFVLLLILSGITAFPVYTELKWMHDNAPWIYQLEAFEKH